MCIKMMSREEIQKQLGWTNMIRNVLGAPDSNSARRVAGTGQYTRGLYRRERVLAVAQTPEARLEEKRWAETVHGHYPATGWTMRLGDIGDELGFTSRAVGKILDLSGFRVSRQVTDEAVAAGCGVRRWDGDRFHIDWHRDRVVDEIRDAAERRRNPAVADVLAEAVAKQQAEEVLSVRRRRWEDADHLPRSGRQWLVLQKSR